MNWNHQISFVTNRLSRLCGILYRVRNNVAPESLTGMHDTLCHSLSPAVHQSGPVLGSPSLIKYHSLKIFFFFIHILIHKIFLVLQIFINIFFIVKRSQAAYTVLWTSDLQTDARRGSRSMADTCSQAHTNT